MSTLILFDFDGTLADTAPDLVAAANRQRTRRNLPELPYETLRPFSSQGARGLLGAALNLHPSDEAYETTRLEFLADYNQNSTQHSRLFAGIPELLDTIENNGYAWGIVTNKITYLTTPIVEHFGLHHRSAAIVCGDTTEHAKPHPAPLLFAAETAGFSPNQCLYIGDDRRDIQAAQAAHMPAIGALYGYIDPTEDPKTWQANAYVESPQQLWTAIQHILTTA